MAAVPAADDVGRMEFQLALRRRGVSDQAVLRAMDEVPREYFVASGFTDSAYADQALPIACGQTISQPYVVAYMTEQLVSGGIMILPLGPHAGPQNLVRLTKTEDGTRQEELIAVRFVPLLLGQAREL